MMLGVIVREPDFQAMVDMIENAGIGSFESLIKKAETHTRHEPW